MLKAAAEASARRTNDKVRVVSAGIPLQAEAAAARASVEINVIGLGSLAAVLLLVWLAFRSLRPIVLVALSLAIGTAAAISVTAVVFDRVHLITLVFGATEQTFDPARHKVVSTSICDASAAAPVLKVLHETFGLEYGFITTLHPWLSYQNLMDGPARSQASPIRRASGSARRCRCSWRLGPGRTAAPEAAPRVTARH